MEYPIILEPFVEPVMAAMTVTVLYNGLMGFQSHMTYDARVSNLLYIVSMSREGGRYMDIPYY